MIKKKKIGLFGGTFNPLHLGHIDLALRVKKHFKIDKILFIPAKIPPHKLKEDIAPASIRYLMLKETLKEYKEFEISKEEIDRDGISYSIDTIKKMVKKYQEASLHLILGSDAFLEIDTWQSYKETLSLISTIVIERHSPPALPSKISKFISEKISKNYTFIKQESVFTHRKRKKIFIADLGIKPISSSLIREQLNRGIIDKTLLPKSVIQTIKKHNLYGYLKQKKNRLEK